MIEKLDELEMQMKSIQKSGEAQAIEDMDMLEKFLKILFHYHLAKKI